MDLFSRYRKHKSLYLLALIFIVILASLSSVNGVKITEQRKQQQKSGVTVVSEKDNEQTGTATTEQSNKDQDIDFGQNIHTLNPQLVEALREINDDPSYLQPKDGELVDLSQFEMDPEKFKEMVEIFDWIESQLPPDDPQQIQMILNDVEQYINGEHTNYSDTNLMLDLIRLPDFLYQVDNGADFMKMNGVPILLKTYNKYNPLLLAVLNNNTNETDIETNVQQLQSLRNVSFHYRIMSQIMDVIGVACQNNPKAIDYAHQSNLVAFIINELNNIYLNYKENNIAMNSQLMNKLIFTLSSVTRQSDTGLRQFRKGHGPKVLYKSGKLLNKEWKKSSNENIINDKKKTTETTTTNTESITTSTDDDDKEEEENGISRAVVYRKNVERAFRKLLTMVSDIVILNGNSLEYSQMFLSRDKWCSFMIEKGLSFYPEPVLQFLNYGLERNYCVELKMLQSLQKKLEQIVEQTQQIEGKSDILGGKVGDRDRDKDKDKEDSEEEDDLTEIEDYFDDGLHTQANSMLKFVKEKLNEIQKIEL